MAHRTPWLRSDLGRGQAVLGRQSLDPTPWHTERHGYDPTLRRRRDTYNMQLDYAAQQEKAGKVFLIRPIQPVTVGRMERNPEKIRSLYQIGYLDGKANAAKVKTFLSGR